MKVLLFVQNGDARPRCEARNLGGDTSELIELATACAESLRADRWWLVECQNAEAGRTLIALTKLVSAARRYGGADETAPVTMSGNIPPGRILASGGRP